MLRPRLADKGAHIDEAGRDDVALAIDEQRFGRDGVGPHVHPEPGDDAKGR